MRDKHIVLINRDRCIGCKLCIRDCPANALVLKNKKASVVKQECIKCGHCVAICPSRAVAMSGFEDQPEPLTADMKVNPAHLLGQLKARRSMRHFTGRDVPREMIEQIIAAGRYTPSGSNKQSVSYVVIKDNLDEYERIALSMFRRLKMMMDIFSDKRRDIIIDKHFLFKKAPVVIVIKASDPLDGALAASSMELMAQSMGLGVLYSGFFTYMAKLSKRLRKMLRVTPREKLVTTLVIGYPAVKYQRTAPKERPDVLFQ